MKLNIPIISLFLICSGIAKRWNRKVLLASNANFINGKIVN